MGQQSLIYSFVARGTVILVEYTEFTGNFTSIASQCLQKLPATNNKFTYNCDGHTFNYLVENGFSTSPFRSPLLLLTYRLSVGWSHGIRFIRFVRPSCWEYAHYLLCYLEFEFPPVVDVGFFAQIVFWISAFFGFRVFFESFLPTSDWDLHGLICQIWPYDHL